MTELKSTILLAAFMFHLFFLFNFIFMSFLLAWFGDRWRTEVFSVVLIKPQSWTALLSLGGIAFSVILSLLWVTSKSSMCTWIFPRS